MRDEDLSTNCKILYLILFLLSNVIVYYDQNITDYI